MRDDNGMLLYAGIDGGGTKTLAVLVDESGTERGRGLAGSGNYATIGQEETIANIGTAVKHALGAAGSGAQLGAAWIGLAGVDRPADRARLFPALQRLAPRIELGNDAELALAALPDAQGVALIAGTGAIALGRDHRGEIVRASGWGHVFGDEGSGYDIGRQALQAAAQAFDKRGPNTALLTAIVDAWDLPDPTAIIDRVYHPFDPGEIARLAAVVFTAATGGDDVAKGIVRTAVKGLAGSVLAVAHQLEFDANVMPLAISGGLLTSRSDFRGRVVRRLRRHVALGAVEVVTEPALSAALAARRLGTSPSSS